MTAVLEQLKAACAEQIETTAERYRDLVAQLACDTHLEAADAQAILTAAGKSFDDLSKDVAKFEDRNRKRELLDEAAEAEAERRQLLAGIAAAEAKLKASQQEHDRTVAPIKLRLDEINHLGSQAAITRNELIATCDDAQLLERGRSVNDRIRVVESRIRDLAHEQRRASAQPGGQSEADRIGEQIGNLRAERDQLIAEAEEITEAKVRV